MLSGERTCTVLLPPHSIRPPHVDLPTSRVTTTTRVSLQPPSRGPHVPQGDLKDKWRNWQRNVQVGVVPATMLAVLQQPLPSPSTPGSWAGWAGLGLPAG